MEDYLKAIDLLTISGDKVVLHVQVAELKEKAKTMNILLKVNHRKRQTDRGFDKEATRNGK